MSWERPLAFLLLPLVAVVLGLGRRHRGRRWHAATYLRAAGVFLLVLALAGPAVPVPDRGARVLFLVDRSLSVTAEGRAQEDSAVARAVAAMRPQDRAGIVAFGGTPVLSSPPEPSLPLVDPGTVPEPDATDIAAAIEFGLRVLGSEGTRRLVLLSDGAATQGHAVAAARAAAATGVTIDAIPVGGPTGPEVLVDSVRAPPVARVGEQVEVDPVLWASDPADAVVVLRRNGQVVGRRRLGLRPGFTAVRFLDHLDSPGVLRYGVEVTASPDTLAANNRGGAVVVVQGRPQVLFVARSPASLPRWLGGQHLSVDVRPPDALPADLVGLAPYGAVVLDDVPATDLSAGQQETLRRYVDHMGGGLVVIGGPHSYGVGGYAGTPLEDVLPLRMDVRQRAAVPTVAVVVVIDSSGSMEAFGSELAKEELAKEIASSVIDHLSPHDQIGVLSFDQEYRWLVPLTEARYRGQILDQVARIRAGGGTVMYPALAEAHRALTRSAARLRHVVVLSDGLTETGDFRALASAMARERITVSTVAIGGDADVGFMRELARWGGGRSYVAKDLYSIPEIFTTEAFLAVRSYIVEERTPLERRGRGASPLEGIPSPPPVEGYVAATAKDRADVVLASPRSDPVLATWRYGLGRVAAFTSDDGLRWTASWATWRDVAHFWSQLVRWTLRDEGRGLYLLVSSARGTARAVLEARHPDGGPWDGLRVLGDVELPAGGHRTVVFDQTAPGRYEAAWQASVPGVYTVTAAARDHRSSVGTRSAGVVVPYSPELRPATGGAALLSQIVETSGGRILRDPGEAFRRGPGTGRQDAWPLLASLALGVLVVEVAVRRAPALVQQLALVGAWLQFRRSADPLRAARRREEDAAYDSADRWAAEDARYADERTRAQRSMEEAAQVYISRLRTR